MVLSDKNRALLIAVSSGVKIDADGLVTNSKGCKCRGQINNEGYRELSVRLGKNKITTVSFHRLQAYQKYGSKIFEKSIVVRHLNGDKLDNRVDNVDIGTHSENRMDIDPKTRKLLASNPKYDHAAILADRSLGLSYKEIMTKYGISSKGTVSFICNKSLKVT